MRWLPLPDANLFILFDGTTLHPNASSLGRDLRQAMHDTEAEGVADIYLVAETDSDARVVVLTHDGLVLYSQLRFSSEFNPPEEALGDAMNILEPLAPYLAAGCAVRSIRAGGSLSRLTEPRVWPRREDPPINNDGLTRVLAGRWILDAFPVMYLGDGFPAVPGAAAGYVRTDLSTGSVLTTKHLQAWFSGIHPPPEVVHEARDMLRSIILTHSIYQQLRTDGVERWVALHS